MYKPSYLEKGDKVALVSPAGAIASEKIDESAKLISSWGLEPVIAKNAKTRNGYFAGTDAERAADMQEAMDSDDIKAIFCNRGGYGSIRIVQGLDYSLFQGNPKWLIGFSDISVFLAKLSTLGVESLHAPMPSTFNQTSDYAMDMLRRTLFGELPKYSVSYNKLNRLGKARGELSGGNLSIIHSIRSSSIEHKYKDAIMFLEDVGENLYSIDRMMISMKLAGRFDRISGLIVGAFNKMRGDNFGKTAYEIIRETVDEFKFPICFDFPAGHIQENYPLIIGSELDLNVTKDGSIIKFREDD